MKKIPARRGMQLLAAALVLLAGSAIAQGQLQERATVNHYSDGIQFHPLVDFSDAVLTVSGGEVLIHQVFSSEEYPSISLYDAAGNVLPDGSYRWQLELRPDAATATELRRATTLNGGETPDPWTAQSGIFRILDGYFVSPDEVEAGAAVTRTQAPDRVIESRVDSFGASPASDSDAADRPEAEVQAEAARAAGSRVSEFGAGLAGPDPSAGPDTDGGTGREVQKAETVREAVPSRSIEPGGNNGRPTGEENDN